MIILDTHALVWLDAGSDQLGSGAIRLINQGLAENQLAVSAISFWEVAMLVNKGRLSLNITPAIWRKELIGRGLLEIPVDGSIGLEAASLAGFHGDPADRLIVSTVLATGSSLVTADKKILHWTGLTQKHDARR